MKFLVHAPMHGTAPIGTVLTPSLTRTYAGWSSRGKVFGQPGTMPIPAPNEPIPRSFTDLARIGRFSPRHAPEIWYPSIYFENDSRKEKFPGSVFSDNQMPVPAERAPNVIVALPYRARLGGQRQVTQPQVVPRWRGMRGSSHA